MVRRQHGVGPRRLDAIILPSWDSRIARWRDVLGKDPQALKGQDVIVVQAKAHRLGMYLMGQTFFSAQLIQRFEPASVKSVALCRKDDAVLRPLLERYPGMEVVVI